MENEKMDIEEDCSNHETEYTDETDRDEVLEVRKVAQKDTYNVMLWRFAMTGALLLTAVAVTMTTYTFLQREQYNDFKTAFEQFSRTVGDAAIQHQQHVRGAYSSFANTITAYASSTNVTWPFFNMPNLESYARHTREQSNTEVLGVNYIVTRENKEKWIEYANANYESMLQEAHLAEVGHLHDLTPEGYHPYISAATADGLLPDEDRDYYAVVWNYSPPPFTYGITNWNLMSIDDYDQVCRALIELKNETLATRVRNYVSVGIALKQEEHDKMHSKLPDSQSQHPHTFLFHPVHEVVDDYNSPIVAIVGVGMAWDASLLDLLPEGVTGIQAVIKNNCNQSYTYEINGPEAIFLGEGDIHETKYDDMEVVVDLALHTHPNFTTTSGHCQYSMHIYPSSKFEASYDSTTPEIFAGVVAATFVLVAVIFFIYDMFVQRRNEKLVENAARSNAIVSSLFPSNIRERLVEQTSEGINASNRVNNLKAFLAGGMAGEGGTGGNRTIAKPLADLFLDTTILFADICGFTAWSSVREPTQVFTLLETVYQSFDHIAKRRRVFKVETVGDCYVAATGLPDPVKNHAIIMVKFARLILEKVHVLVKDLEITLGPDTGDLSIRVGIHSGPVTAGVLRGERARFQLFGDTVNTAARIEATGVAGRIHLSQETAERLVSAGKGHWLERRDETVQAKGKGDIQTYFLSGGFDYADRCSVISQESHGSATASTKLIKTKKYEERMRESGLDESALRLVDWNVEMLSGILKQIISRRAAVKEQEEADKVVQKQKRVSGSFSTNHRNRADSSTGNDSKCLKSFESSPFDDIQEIIHLPEFDSRTAGRQKDPEHVEIPNTVTAQLRDYITAVAKMYQDNAFHNFEHASHVTMSVIKLLSRIVAPTDIVDENELETHAAAATLHDHTYGITSDPLTQFACAFSALIHDTDHSGVPNAQLIKEGSKLAEIYMNRSVAEQNSLVLAWDLLMAERFDDFRSCLCANETELRRFRQLVVNSVMATDIVDKNLKNLRNARWDAAFKQQKQEDKVAAVNRKATIVIEHLIQASDVAHTMQHWHVYRKWNERFFRECYAAYKAGRAEKDPSENWYKGEIGFFDFYIIPLAKKLENCGVFGKSSDEYLNYAKSNRQEWEVRGEAMVAEMMESISREEKEEEEKIDLPTDILHSVLVEETLEDDEEEKKE